MVEVLNSSIADVPALNGEPLWRRVTIGTLDRVTRVFAKVFRGDFRAPIPQQLLDAFKPFFLIPCASCPPRVSHACQYTHTRTDRPFFYSQVPLGHEAFQLFRRPE